MTIYETLKEDHEKVLALLDKLMDSKNADLRMKEKLVRQIEQELIPHARAEEAVLYNSMREIPIVADLMKESYREHLEAETVLRSLQVTEAIKIDWTKGAESLKSTLTDHISEEEGKIFNAAKQLFSLEEAEAMGDVFVRMKAVVSKQSFLGTSLDALINRMPTRLREAFGKYSLEGEFKAKVS